MYYIIENWKILYSNNFAIKVDWLNTIEKEFTSEELEKIQAWYSYNIETWEFEESPESIEYEKQVLENKKTSLLKEIWELKQIKDWMELVWEDITETTAKINDLISEYKSL